MSGLLITLAVLAGGWLLLIGLLWLHRPSRELAGITLRLVPDVARLVRRLLADRAIPLDARLGLLLAAGWILSPIDLIPEFIPVLGPLDDIVVAVLALRWAVRRAGRQRVSAAWSGSPEGLRLLWRLLGS